MSWLTCFRLIILSISLFLPHPSIAAEPTGEQLYAKQCARCHGPAGEGSKKYEHPLAGDLSIPQLAKLVRETMPENAPNTLTEGESTRIAGFMHEAFYSQTARNKNAPPRVELSRLTVRQYRNTVADLISSLKPGASWDDRRGLKGEYFNASHYRGDRRIIDRIDPEVRFNFGIDSPQPDKMNPYRFAIYWFGSVLAPETGWFEFTVRSNQAVRLYVNDPKTALIDATVRSGSETEHRGAIYLIAGHAYPVKLEFAKAAQGVDDEKKKPTSAPEEAYVALAWKPPITPAGIIPSNFLCPNQFPPSLAVTTQFPPDDRSLGWERGTTISKAWDQATTDAAIETAAYVCAHVRDLSGIDDAAKDRPALLRDFCRRLADRAFRRPLTAEQKRVYVDHPFETNADPDSALRRSLILILKSPRFLYREIGGTQDGYDIAAKLSFALWDSLPDQPLFDAAAQGKLATHQQVLAQAERMMKDPRAKTKLRDFLFTWLRVDQIPDLAKDSKKFPGFDHELAGDLRYSLGLFLDDVASSEGSDFRKLFAGNDVYLNGRLGRFYGVNLPSDSPFQKVALDPGKRAGVLTHPYITAAYAYSQESSPIHRGVFLARGVLGVSLRPPAEAFTPLPPDLHPGLSTRERVTLQTKPAACVTCHGVINPLGFTLENFDAVGRYRETDRGKPVDATGSYLTRAGKTVAFQGAPDLARFVATSDDAHGTFVEQLFHHLIKQPIRAYGPRRLADFREFFANSGFNIRKIMVEIAVETAMPAPAAKPAQKP